ncbi:hypothetical protein [Staphylococcus equorum]|uniref:hypothetical protein n=1 Tax=Staphylococcus equorum TaxID=246432 RepID=UPI003980DEC8
MHDLEKYDFKRLESFIKKYEEYKQGLNNENYSGGRAENIRNIVDSFEQVYDRCGEQPKQIIQMSWLQPETDEVIKKVLEIPQQRLNNIRTKVLLNLSEEMAYV